jgi:chromosome partitioning protein
MSKIISIVNQKGGVGKTTTAYNLAYSLSRYEKKVLLIDLDPQGNCSLALGIDPSLSKKTVSELLTGKTDLKKAIRKTEFNFSIIPSNLSLALCESSLSNEGSLSYTILKEKLQDPKIEQFDYVIIDLPPSLGFLATTGLVASDSLIIPIQCEYYSLNNLTQLFATISNIKNKFNLKINILGILLTMFDSRTNLSIESENEIRSAFKEYVFTTIIPRNISIPEALYNSKPVGKYKPTSLGARAYLALAREIIEKSSQ